MTLLPDLQTRLDEAARRHDVPGAVVAVGYESELAEAATGVVNRNTGVATTPESVFQIGSVTKVWTTALVMQLVDEGLVELDQPVRRYLPGFAVVDPEATETVTVRQLLSHTGGFDGDLFEDTGRGGGGARRVPRRLRLDVEPRGGATLRHTDGRYRGARVHAAARRRAGRVRLAGRRARQADHPARRHLRHHPGDPLGDRGRRP